MRHIYPVTIVYGVVYFLELFGYSLNLLCFLDNLNPTKPEFNCCHFFSLSNMAAILNLKMADLNRDRKINFQRNMADMAN